MAILLMYDSDSQSPLITKNNFQLSDVNIFANPIFKFQRCIQTLSIPNITRYELFGVQTILPNPFVKSWKTC